jgi:exodeoxyribonuclease (lambda-induced)
VIVHQHEQGTDEWLSARRGAITGSRFSDARDRTAKGAMTSRATLYAQDVARERCGGAAPGVFVNAAMRTGTEQEPLARLAYEARTGNMVEEAGFITTDDSKFGVSVDGLVDDDGMIEIKTMVSSGTLFKAVVEGDHSDYLDQINGSLWLLGRKWCDLILWAPDLPAGKMTIIRIERDDNVIQKLEDDLISFEKLVSDYESKLRRVMSADLPAEVPELKPWPTPEAPTSSPPWGATEAPAVRAQLVDADF